MISIVIPTYKERANIRSVLERISACLSEQNLSYEIIIVDDDSPDGTADAAREVAEELPGTVRVIVRTSNPDLSRSVVRGFREATGEILVVMDADLQHPPESIPDLAVAVSLQRPIAIGTRYSNGGEITDWTVDRRLVSRGATLLAKVLVPPTRGVSDPISGFFAVHATALEGIDLTPRGYKILVEILTAVDPDQVAEVGFRFEPREHGETSLNLGQYWRYLRHVLRCGVAYRRGKWADMRS